jgi:IPT/TIG domain
MTITCTPEELVAFMQFANAQYDKIISLLFSLSQQITAVGANMAADLTSITAAVNESVTVEQSAITLINGLANQISLLQNDPAALQALSVALTSQATALAAAVTTNTPVAVPPVVPVVPVITSISPTTGPTETPVTLTGTGFGATQGTSTAAGLDVVTSWSDTQIVAPVTTGIISVTTAGGTSNVLTFVVSASASIKK